MQFVDGLGWFGAGWGPSAALDEGSGHEEGVVQVRIPWMARAGSGLDGVRLWPWIRGGVMGRGLCRSASHGWPGLVRGWTGSACSPGRGVGSRGGGRAGLHPADGSGWFRARRGSSAALNEGWGHGSGWFGTRRGPVATLHRG